MQIAGIRTAGSTGGVFRRSGAVFCLVALAAIVAFSPTARAQSTIFNIPTTDTVAPKKGYFEFDYLVQTPKTDGADRVHIITPRIIAGVMPNLEVGANFANVKVGDSTYSYFQPNIKYRMANDDKGIAGSIGIIGYTPINHRDGVDSYGLVYGNLSYKLMASSYGPRITAGPYGILGAADSYVGTRAGAIVGYEQPIAPRVSFVADWFSGVSGFGYFTPGVSIALPRASLLNIGYSFGNDSYDGNNNRFLFVYFGITFP